MAFVFWLGIAIIGFTYVGYGLVVSLWVKLRPKRTPPHIPTDDAELPNVTLLIAAYNEASILPDKMANCQALDYPPDKLHILLVTDGSDDGSEQLFPDVPHLTRLHQPQRQGKIAAVKRAMVHVQTPITVFTDANTFLNPSAIRRMVADFADPTVGAVAGEKQVIATGNAASNGEGLYWRYESYLKRKDSELYTVVGAAGELYAIRTACYHDVPADTILDDFMHTLLIAKDGYRVTYAPEAVAMEHASANVKEELKRKIRISAGGWQSMHRMLPLLNIFRYGILSFQYIGHRVLRWSLAAFSLPVVLVLNVVLAAQGTHWVYPLLLLGQVAGYGLAMLGYVLRGRQVNIPGFFAPYYFVVMNYSVFAGCLRYLRGQQTATWEKAKRQEARS
jgi:cellulose synthase/poly-beta-1,6-N-acetylglucosamine synthase-like glycosyltransferase